MFKPWKKAVSIVVSTLIFIGSLAILFAQSDKIGIVNADTLNIRQSPNTNSKILNQLSRDTRIEILDSSNGWSKVSANNIVGWASSDYITIKDNCIGTAITKATNVNLRSSNNTDSRVIITLDKGVSLNLINRTNDWYKVKTSNGTIGWIFKDLLSVKTPNISRGGVDTRISPATSTKSNLSTSGQKLVEYGKNFMGVRYVYGGTSPNGFDCSGFVKYVYNHFGIGIERVAAGQACSGIKISRSNLQPGDLVFFDTNGGHGYINHVGMYIGNGNFIHASSGRSSYRVTISSLNSSFYSNCYMTARRYVD